MVNLLGGEAGSDGNCRKICSSTKYPFCGVADKMHSISLKGMRSPKGNNQYIDPVPTLFIGKKTPPGTS